MQVSSQPRAALTQVPQSPEAYLNSRRRDYNSLLNEISESKDLGYCLITSPTTFEVKGECFTFASNTSLKAAILARFW